MQTPSEALSGGVLFNLKDIITTMEKTIQYPRRRAIRAILKTGIAMAFGVLADFEVEGKENIPSSGPLLVVANHFHFLDPLALIHTAPWPIEFVGGAQTPNAPGTVSWLSKAFGVIPTYRGTGSRETLLNAEAILKQKGVLAIFPEGGSWAQVLRPPRPGTAFLAWKTRAQILPLGLDGFVGFFKRIKFGERAHVKVKFGKPFGPLAASDSNRPGRDELDEIGHTIMRKISYLLPPERQGFYSPDPAIREAARGTEIYPWESTAEA
jgi:1-acyl-sn-glycerol-3-phosphate acyltransferase